MCSCMYCIEKHHLYYSSCQHVGFLFRGGYRFKKQLFWFFAGYFNFWNNMHVSCKELLTEKTHSGFLKHDWTLTVSCCPTAVKAIARVGTWGEGVGVVYVYTYPTALGWKLKKSLHTPIIVMLWPFLKLSFFWSKHLSSRGWVTASLFQTFQNFHRGLCC